jgi:hypothetical protein
MLNETQRAEIDRAEDLSRRASFGIRYQPQVSQGSHAESSEWTTWLVAAHSLCAIHH